SPRAGRGRLPRHAPRPADDIPQPRPAAVAPSGRPEPGRPMTAIRVRTLDAAEAHARAADLAAILEDCVAGNASVSFMAPLSGDKAQAFWRKVADGVAMGGRILLVAEDGQGHWLGTVQLVLDLPENQ